MTEKKPEGQLADTRRLSEIFERYRTADISDARDASPPTRQLANIKLIDGYLEQFAGVLHERNFASAAEIAHLIAGAMEHLPTLDRVLWGEICRTYERNAGAALPPPKEIMETHDPSRTLLSLAGNNRETLRTFSGHGPVKAVLARLKSLGRSPLTKPLLFLLPMMALGREVSALPVEAARRCRKARTAPRMLGGSSPRSRQMRKVLL